MTASPRALAPETAPRSRWSRYGDPFRLASYVLVLFTIGHTLGAVIGTPRLGADSDTVVAAMKSVHVVAQGADCTWYGFYRGFGAMISVFFAMSIVITWHVGGLPAAARRRLAPITWALFATFLANTVVAWFDFFAVPQIMSLAVVVLLGIGCLRSGRDDDIAAPTSPPGA